MEVSIIRLPEGIEKWHLVAKFFQLRKDVFIDKMDWALHQDHNLEYEQYDMMTSVYVIAHEGDRVLGGARLVRTDWKQNIGKVVYSYMIRDAYLGLLPGLPTNICDEEPPVDPEVWELTRLTSVKGVMVGEEILEAMDSYLQGLGAKQCLFLGPPVFLRLARMLAYDPKPLGKIVGNKDGRFLAFACGIRNPERLAEKEARRARTRKPKPKQTQEALSG